MECRCILVVEIGGEDISGTTEVDEGAGISMTNSGILLELLRVRVRKMNISRNTGDLI